jgi:hypothetical protein
LRYQLLTSAIAVASLATLAQAQGNLTPPSPQKVVIVMLENHDYQEIVGDNVNAPYLNSVIKQGLLFNNAHAIEHPSQPNYLDMFSGSNQGVASVNGTPSNPYDLNALAAQLQAAINSPNTPASALPGLKGQLAQIQGALAAGLPANYATGDAFPITKYFNPIFGEPIQIPFTTPNLGSVLMQAGKTFTEYAEGLNDAGAADAYGYANIAKINDPADPYSIGYAHRHDPAADWISATPSGNQLPRTAVQDFANFGSQNTDFSYLPNVSLVVPNTINDMHDGTVPASTQVGDAWCKKNLSNYLAWASTHNSLLIITTDESDTDATNHIMAVVAGDPRIVQQGVSTQYVTHYDMLRTVEAMFGTSYTGWANVVYGWIVQNGKILATPAQ